MAATPGLDLINGLLAIGTAIALFAAGGFSVFIRMKLPERSYSVIFPYLSVGMMLLGFMMVAYSLIFFTHQEIVALMPTILFLAGTLVMMLGAYKVTEALGVETAQKARAASKSKKN